ncbi:MAG: hypothetical protein MIO93_01370 [ANME-2 cluster archaeon]|jgi:hypothetical protein|nr:hypothetical protein [ANME-2 cluster archaeon]
MIKDLYIVFPLWLLFFPLSVFWISEKIALCGIYHNVDSFFRDKSADAIKKECLVDKLRMILSANIYLSFPFIISYYVVINSTLNEESTISTEEIALFAFMLTLVSLFAIRFLSSPPNFLSSKIPALYPKNEKKDAQKVLNERIVSFFHSFVCAALMILGIIVSANIIADSNVLESNPIIRYQFLGAIVAFYSFSLILLTIFLEITLYKFPPIVQIPQE